MLTPPTYDTEPARRFPTLYVLHSMTAQARSFFNVSPFSENLPARLEQAALEAIVVLVDGFTSLGGAQWIDSPAIGAYGTYLCEDVVGFVDAGFRTLPDAARTAGSQAARRAGSAPQPGRCSGPISSPGSRATRATRSSR